MQTVAKKVGLSDSNRKYFALFLRAAHDFGKATAATMNGPRVSDHMLDRHLGDFLPAINVDWTTVDPCMTVLGTYRLLDMCQ